MTTVAIIPARGGSQGVPGKNLKPVGGVPLIGRAVRACRTARLIDHVYVTTDAADIAEVARAEGAEIIHRPADLASSTASSESALLHALDEIADHGVDPRTLVFVQCTSPFLEPKDLDAGVELVTGGEADSVFSGVETFEFLWRDAEDSCPPGTGPMVGQNHDASHRPRRQDRRPDYRETGAFYVMDVKGFLRAQHRFFGTTRVVPVSELASLEIDTAEELALADAFAGILDSPPADLPLDVDVVFSVVDGILTSGACAWQGDGAAVTIDRADVIGLNQLDIPWVVLPQKLGTPAPERLGLTTLPGSTAQDITNWLDEHGISPERAALISADVETLDAMTAVGWPIAVPDAPASVRSAARLVLTFPAGRGAVRELCDRIAEARTP